MEIRLNKLLMPFIVLTSSGVGVLSVCVSLSNLNKYVQITATSNASRYLVTCEDSSLKLYPLGESNVIECQGEIWMKSKETINLTSIRCLHMCSEPFLENLHYIVDDTFVRGEHMVPISKLFNGNHYYIPGVKINLECTQGLHLSPVTYSSVCGDDGQWKPAMPACLSGETTTKNIEQGVSPDPNQTLIISVTVTIVAVLACATIMIAIAVRAKWRGACRKRHAPTSHPDDINYPHGYTQLGSGSMLPSYAEATEDGEEIYREGHHTAGVFSVYRPTTTSDYRQLSSLESSSRGESESLSAGSHRHSLFSGSSSNYRNVVGGDDISDILLQGDHLSMSDTSTLVTVNTYESNRTASNPSLSNSRRGVAGSMVSNTATSMDDAPLIVRRTDDEPDDNAQSNIDC